MDSTGPTAVRAAPRSNKGGAPALLWITASKGQQSGKNSRKSCPVDAVIVFGEPLHAKRVHPASIHASTAPLIVHVVPFVHMTQSRQWHIPHGGNIALCCLSA
jgi:hypothetical protein